MTGTATPAQVSLVGGLRVEQGTRIHHGATLGSRKGRTVLAVLALRGARGGRAVDATQLAALLWPGAAPARAESVVASLVSRLRRGLGGEIIVGDRAGYRLGPDVAVDVEIAARYVAEAERRAAAEPALAATAGRAALSILDGGTVLADEPDADWVHDARAAQAALLRRSRHVVVAAALASGEAGSARDVATAALTEDPLDEKAARGLMRSYASLGEPAEALQTYTRLRAELAEQLGADPAWDTQQVHAAVLRGEHTQAARTLAPRPALLALAGRSAELAELHEAWTQATAGRGGVVLLTGLPGAGKTRLAEELAETVSATGGTVLSARCYEAERGLFLQPFVEAIARAAARWPAARIRAAVTEHGDSLARLVPEVRIALDEPIEARGRPDVERRRSIDAVSGFLCGLAAGGPVLIVLDDLHNAGDSTIELLHSLRTRITTTPLLVVGTVRSVEGAGVRTALRATAHPLEVGALPASAVTSLATAAGHPALADEITNRTGGHALFVVELLRGLDAGNRLPGSLHDAVDERLQTLGDDAVLRAAAVLGSAFEPGLAASVADIDTATALRECERAYAGGLLIAAGAQYEFANDVLREVIYELSPMPSRLAWHARAADLLAHRPEQLAGHAEVIEDWPRAAQAWLRAAEDALDRCAATDAIGLAGSALSAADRAGSSELRARAYVARGRARYVVGDFAECWTDLGAAIEAARECGDRRLEMAALRERVHDVHVALGNPPADTEEPLRACRRIARSLGDRAGEADLLSRLAVLATGRLDFTQALDLGDQALRIGRAAGRRKALVCGLDAVKTPNVYLGRVERADAVIDELVPLARAEGDLLRLQWAIFESFVGPLAAGDYTGAVTRIEEALAMNRRTGYTSFEPFFLAHLGWVQRLCGDLDAAAASGAQAVAAARDQAHMWWASTATAMYATTLLTLDRRADAARVLQPVTSAVDVAGAEAYQLRCRAALAAATGSLETLSAADAALQTITAPAGCAWLLGADAYLGVARAWVECGDTERARRALAPFRHAAGQVPWPALVGLADAVVDA